MFRLQDLVLANNTFNESIPIRLANCSGLKTIDLSRNKIIGSIPLEFGSLEKLEILIMERNDLTGGLPPSLGNISSLKYFSIGGNNLEGNIPTERGQLKFLLEFIVDANELSGIIPSSVFNISSLRILSMTANALNGTLPDNIGLTLPNLFILACGGNDLSGTIPITLSNISSLQGFELAHNNFWGQVPNSLGNLQERWRLSIYENNLGSNSSKDLDFLNYLTNCSKLEIIMLSSSNFGGVLPRIVGNLSIGLKWLAFGGNKISGSIPTEIGNLINLFCFGVRQNL